MKINKYVQRGSRNCFPNLYILPVDHDHGLKENQVPKLTITNIAIQLFF